MRAKIEAKLSSWRSTLILQAKCTPQEATILITQLKRQFKPFPETTIDTLMQSPVFLDRIQKYNQYGLNATLHWIRHCPNFTQIPPLDGNVLSGIAEAANGVGSEPIQVNIYGALTSFKTPERKALREQAINIAKEISLNSDEPNPKLINYLFAQLAKKMNHTLNTDVPQSIAKELYAELVNQPCSLETQKLFTSILHQTTDLILEELRAKPVVHLGLEINQDDPYEFSTINTLSIWFSNNPKKAMPDHLKAILMERARILSPGETRLIYSPACLEPNVAKEFKTWAGDHGIQLINFEDMHSELNGQDLILADLAELELSRMREHTGGNPAAASDLVRWIPILSDQPYVYIDVDMPLIDRTPEETTVKSGHPVLLNMGSVLIKQGDQLPLEVVAFNTDILSFSASEQSSNLDQARFSVIEKIRSSLIANYNDCIDVIAQSKAPALAELRTMVGYQSWLANAEKEAVVLPQIRHIVTQGHKNMTAYAQFLGVRRFAERYSAGKEQGLIQEALTQGNEQALTQILLAHVRPQFLDAGMDDRTIVETELKNQAASLYKPLVLEFSGPGAVTTVIMEGQVEDPPRQFPPLKEEYLASPLRILQHHACCIGKTNFRSENIPAWEMPKEQSDAQQQERQEGLSWMPAEQHKLAL